MASCVTGNCTWEDYQSMGVCSTVTDISSTITSKCPKPNIQYRPPGCNYSVSAIDQNPAVRDIPLRSHKYGETLWVGASQRRLDYNINTLIQFYVIYVPDFTTWDQLDFTKDEKDELVALQATLSLCLNKYHTDMTFGVTNTTLLSKEIDLDWQASSEVVEGTSSNTTIVTHDGDNFVMGGSNQELFHLYLSNQIFIGTASMRSESESPDGGGNLTETDGVKSIAASLYEDRAGIRGLSDLLDRLTISMSNA
ncbi:MAG: hypothetical protein Q9184_007413, partial [Pyrenodesmia sp. 2 TL-2023]